MLLFDRIGIYFYIVRFGFRFYGLINTFSFNTWIVFILFQCTLLNRFDNHYDSLQFRVRLITIFRYLQGIILMSRSTVCVSTCREGSMPIVCKEKHSGHKWDHRGLACYRPLGKTENLLCIYHSINQYIANILMIVFTIFHFTLLPVIYFSLKWGLNNNLLGKFSYFSGTQSSAG